MINLYRCRVEMLSYLSPSLSRSLHCRLHSWSKTCHSLRWYQLPWQGLKNVNKQFTIKSWFWWQAVLRCVIRLQETSAALPSKITRGRGKCRNHATISTAHVSVCTSTIAPNSNWVWPKDTHQPKINSAWKYRVRWYYHSLPDCHFNMFTCTQVMKKTVFYKGDTTL